MKIYIIITLFFFLNRYILYYLIINKQCLDYFYNGIDGYDTPAHFHARKLLSPDIGMF